MLKYCITQLDSLANKKKLLIIFVLVIFFTLIILYFQNAYNLPHQMKSIAVVTNKNNQNLDNYKTKQNEKIVNNNSVKPNNANNNEEDDLKVQAYDIFNDKYILNDNKNNENKTKCWQVESFKIVQKCAKCDIFSTTSLKACSPTGFRELIQCSSYGQVSRSCPIPTEILKKHYWTFEFVSLLVTILFSSFVIKRKSFLDKQATERVRQQLLSS